MKLIMGDSNGVKSSDFSEMPNNDASNGIELKIEPAISTSSNGGCNHEQNTSKDVTGTGMKMKPDSDGDRRPNEQGLFTKYSSSIE